MDAELTAVVQEISETLALLKVRIRYDESKIKLAEITSYLNDSALWNDPDRAKKIMQEQAALGKSISQYDDFMIALSDYQELYEMAESEGDQLLQEEARQNILQLRAQVADAGLESLLSDEFDHYDCFIEIHAGAGGTESQDWALMLMRMYTRWIASHGYEGQIMEESPGEEAGIKSVSIKVVGYNAFGWLKSESGVHRLVRISPFDSQARRHTSFASVAVYPDMPDDIEVEINDKDIRIDTYRASGAGGQHINKTDSAVRITHFPTGIVVQCQNDRSQHKNKAEAFRMLKAKLYDFERRKREENRDNSYDNQTDIGWGHQIRSYVMHPYQMVKDLRTDVQVSNVQKVMDGDLDVFLRAMLAASHKE